MNLRGLLVAGALWAAMMSPVAEAQLPAPPGVPPVGPLPLPVPIPTADPASPPAVPGVPGVPGAPAPPAVPGAPPLPPGTEGLVPIPFPSASDPLGYAAALASWQPDAQDLGAIVAAAAALTGQGGLPALLPNRTGSLEQAMLYLYEVLGLALTPEQRALLSDAASGVDDAIAEPVALLLFAIADTHAALARQLESLPAAERQLLAECGLTPADPSLGAPACSDPARAREAALKYLAAGKVLGFELGLLAAVGDALEMLEEVAESYGVPLVPHGHSSASGTVDNVNIFADPLKLVEIGSLKSDIYRGNTVGSAFLDPQAKVLTIDLAGDDVYEVRAGAAAPYLPAERSLESGELSQHQQQSISFGSLVGLSIDLGGNDHYVGRVGALGAGDLGVGALVDLAGDDLYEASSGSLGAAYVGLGLLFDGAGNDLYTARYRSQGHGMLGGLGLLVDAAGDDRYLGELLVQGAGSIHGVGLLLDAAGADSYTATAGATTASQGASHLTGVGFLVEADGPDRYDAPEGARGYVYEKLQAPWNVGLGVFSDQGGFDRYLGPSRGADDSEWATSNGGRGQDAGSDRSKGPGDRVPPPPKGPGDSVPPSPKGPGDSVPPSPSTGGNGNGDGNASASDGGAGNGSADGDGSASGGASGGSGGGSSTGGGAGAGSDASTTAGGGGERHADGNGGEARYAGPATADARMAAAWRPPPEDEGVRVSEANRRANLDSPPAAPGPEAQAEGDDVAVQAPGPPAVAKETPLPMAIGALALLLGSRMLRRRGG